MQQEKSEHLHGRPSSCRSPAETREHSTPQLRCNLCTHGKHGHQSAGGDDMQHGLRVHGHKMSLEARTPAGIEGGSSARRTSKKCRPSSRRRLAHAREKQLCPTLSVTVSRVRPLQSSHVAQLSIITHPQDTNSHKMPYFSAPVISTSNRHFRNESIRTAREFLHHGPRVYAVSLL
jgi:hypothetical protein